MTAEQLNEENRRRHKVVAAEEALWVQTHYNGQRARRADVDMKRFKDDFPYWADRCVKIRHKLTGESVPFRLNRAQRHLFEQMERMRLQGRPIRVILLKSRQWGGSTLIQVYMAWIQMIHRRNWHSLICAHVKDTAASIRGMYSGLLDDYPQEYVDDKEQRPSFKGFERSQNIRILETRGCRVTIGSAESQEASRGNDLSMAHLSEVAFWRTGARHSPADLMRAVISGIPLMPMTLIAIESTANGVGNFFHAEWERAVAGDSAFEPVFVPWYMTEYNTMKVVDAGALWETLDDYERQLWQSHPGITLEQLCWYHHKRLESPSRETMMAEYPSTAMEAFIHSGRSVFNHEQVEALRRGCRQPVAVGSFEDRSGGGLDVPPGDVVFVENHKPVGGYVEVWERPVAGRSYVVAVDIGGRSLGSDYSVIAVVARSRGERPVEVVAQWRGHIDHDILARRAAVVAKAYNRALLIVESNTLESDTSGGDSSGAYLLQQLNHVYRPLYRRTVEDSVTPRKDSRVGFHTNRRTKLLAISNLIRMVREGGYVERDSRACNEMSTYEQLQGGSFGARPGCHDDILMTRAIALHVIATTTGAEAVSSVVAPLCRPVLV